MTPTITAIQDWGPLAGMVGIIAGLITVWIKGIPARLLAKTAGDATIRGEEKGLREYLKAELKECKNDYEELVETVRALERQHKQDMGERDTQHASDLKKRDDKIFHLEVLSAMLLRRQLVIDPDDDLVRDAKAILELNIGFPIDSVAIEAAIRRLKGVVVGDPKSAETAPKSPAREAAEQAHVAAKQGQAAADRTEECAEQTVAEVKSAEGEGK